MNEYDIVKIFREMETELLNNMTRTMKRHMKNEDIEGINWSQWQVEQLKALQEYRKRNQDIISKYDERTISNLETLLRTSYKEGALAQEREVLQSIVDGARAKPSKNIKDTFKNIKGKNDKDKAKNVLESNGTFFKFNDNKLNALINESKQPLQDATKGILRYQDDVYRQVIFKAQVYVNTGTKTIYQAVDMATKDFLSRGITNITYKNGSKVNIESYAEMCIRTSNKKAKLEGEGQICDEWDEHLILVSQYGAASPTCIHLQGKVYVDDVYSNGKPDGKHPLLSDAISMGLYHPNCRHTHSIWFEGISRMPNPLDNKKVSEHSKLEQQQRYLERQVRKYERLKNGSLDPNNKRTYEMKQVEWSNKLNKLVKDNGDVLRRDPWREITLLKETPKPIKEIPTLLKDEPESIGDILKNTPPKKEAPKVEIHKKEISKVEKPKPIVKEKTVIERLNDKNIKLEGRFGFDSEEIREHLLNQMDDLTNRYKLGNERITIKSKSEKDLGTAAYYTHTRTMSENSITFNKKYFKDLEDLEINEKLSSRNGWTVKSDPGKEIYSTLSHEFGHMVERNLVNKHFNLDTNSKDYFTAYNKVCNDLQKEILDMYKTKYNKDLNISSELSRYALTNSKEFFGEAFCKMETVENSEIGDIMREFLKKYDMIND